MGDQLAPAGLQLLANSRGDPSRSAVGRRRQPACGCGLERRTARGAAQFDRGCRAAHPRGIAGAEYLAATHGNHHHNILHRLDLHPMGGGLGYAADRHRADRLVLADRQQGGRGVRQTIVRDVKEIPTYGFGSQTSPWWGAMAFIALEGMGFAVAIAAYLYLYAVNSQWPLNSSPPDLWPGTLATAVYLLSIIPN